MFNFLKKKNNTPKLPYTTEVHCHVLPGIDDGSPDVEHSLALIHQMKEWGLERIIATPHVTEASFENTPTNHRVGILPALPRDQFGRTGN